MNGIKQASPFGQTSCLEGFHSAQNQFSPKIIAWVQLSRHVLQARNSLVVIFVISRQVDTLNSFLIISGMHLLLFISTTT
jgi:hypothetical protein